MLFVAIALVNELCITFAYALIMISNKLRRTEWNCDYIKIAYAHVDRYWRRWKYIELPGIQFEVSKKAPEL